MNEYVKEKIRTILLTFAESLVITAIVLFVICPVSCKMTAEGVKILDGDYTPPVLRKVEVLDSKTVALSFSESVRLSECVVSPFEMDFSDSMEGSYSTSLADSIQAALGKHGRLSVSMEYFQQNSLIHIILDEEMKVGCKYELYGNVTDKIGNTLTILIPFEGYNSSIPHLLITEVQSESVSSQKSVEKQNGTYRTEFVELLALEEGNLSGIELISGYDGEAKKYEFPAVEVKKGEVFTVHLRNRGNGCISEVEDKLDLAFGLYTDSNSRDLWSLETGTSLGNKTDVIVIRNKQSEEIIDAVFYAAPEIEQWTKEMGIFAEQAAQWGIYENAEIDQAFITEGLTASKTIARKNAFEIQTKVLAGEEMSFPIMNSCSFWEINNEPSPGHL